MGTSSGDLDREVTRGARAYVRNLAAAEAAVLRGQFNVAKVLRAVAHSQRVQALEHGRQLIGEAKPVGLFRAILEELDEGENLPTRVSGPPRSEASVRVRARLKNLVQRCIASLEGEPDILEDDVSQSLWGCYGCGYIVEGEAPDACSVCGALGAEFEWFGPFYSTTPEHLGHLTPAQIVNVLEAVPDQVSDALSGLGDDTLRLKPSRNEWCIKEILGHVIETDRLFVKRVQTVLSGQGMPSVDTPTPPWKLQEGRGYEDMSAADIVAMLRESRSATLDLVRRLTPQQWGRQGTNRGRAVTLIDLGSWLANHDRGHLAQVLRPAGSKSALEGGD